MINKKTKHNYIRKNGYWECSLCGDNFIARGHIGDDKETPDAWLYCEDMKKLKDKWAKEAPNEQPK